MLDQLKELAEMQRDYDNQLLSKIGKKYNKDIAEKMRIALFVELGELMQELPSFFKFWKQQKQDNRDKALEEYVDALKCSLSLANYYELDVTRFYEYDVCDEFISISLAMHGAVYNSNYHNGLEHLFQLGNTFGFEWQEIYKAYKKKHAINLRRLNNGY